MVPLAVLHLKGETYWVPIEPEGLELLRASRRAMEGVWDDLDPGIGEGAT